MTQIYTNGTSTHYLGSIEPFTTLHTRDAAYRANPSDGRDVRLFLTYQEAERYIRS